MCLYVLSSVLWCPIMCLYVLSSVLWCPIMCLYVVSSVLWCPIMCLYVLSSVVMFYYVSLRSEFRVVISYYVSLRSEFRVVMSVTFSAWKRCSVRIYHQLLKDSCLIYVMCVCLRIVASNTYCVVFLFCFSSSCVPYVVSFSFFDSPFRIL
jgi:hypothetical protein